MTQQPPINWYSLRKALGYSQAKMGDMLRLSRQHIIRLEAGITGTPHESTITILRILLRDPAIQERLKQAQYPHPFPEDVRR